MKYFKNRWRSRRSGFYVYVNLGTTGVTPLPRPERPLEWGGDIQLARKHFLHGSLMFRYMYIGNNPFYMSNLKDRKKNLDVQYKKNGRHTMRRFLKAVDPYYNPIKSRYWMLDF